MKNKQGLRIQNIFIEELFGLYTYNIETTSLQETENLLILYGDNGSGKTTVLKLLFYLLSTKDKSGFKTRIAETKFKKLIVTLSNGYKIGAEREKAVFGSFTYFIEKNNKILKSIRLQAKADNSIQLKEGSDDDKKYIEILELIRSLNITTFFLSDDRKVLNTISNHLSFEGSARLFFQESDGVFSKEWERRKISKILHDENRLDLEIIIENLMNWIKNQVINGSRMGEKNSQEVFSDIIKNFINLSQEKNILNDKNSLLRELNELEKQVPKFVEFGLIEKFNSKSIKESLKKADTPEQEKFLFTIISPFIESVKAKLKALDSVCNVIELFIFTINEYFTNKVISFHVSTGFTLRQTFDNEKIDFNWLSSGEKQLLLLLINTIISTDIATIFIIDEPEISLNIKWQRKLIKTLLELSHGNNSQFILATHSFEILSAYKNCVSKLDNINV